VAAEGDGTIEHEAFRRFTESVGGDDDPTIVTELIRQFLGDAPGLVDSIRRGVESGDAEGVRRAAHTLKSNAATFGATELAARSWTLEEEVAEGDLADGRAAAEAIGIAFEEVRRILPSMWARG